MKKFVKVLSILIAPLTIVCGLLAGCKSCKGEKVDIEIGDIMQDMEKEPEVTGAYLQYSQAAYEEYKQVANKHYDIEAEEVDYENSEVVAAATKAAAQLYAYACYNERHLNNYVFFSDMDATTDLGSNGKGVAKRQEYYLRVNEQEGKTCGYRYHYSLKKVLSSSGIIKSFKSKFETARLRFTDETDLLYRFEGDDIEIGKHNDLLNTEMLSCDWRTGDDWGKHDVVMRKAEFIAPENIEEDIVEYAGGDPTIRGNINILAENVVQYAMITEDEENCINVFMTINTEVANQDKASVKMLTKTNGTDGDCHWKKGDIDPADSGFGVDTGLRIAFRIWKNSGLFRMYSITERWRGKIVAFNGTADSTSYYYYSYTERDCDMTKHLEMLEEAKRKKG